MHRFYGFAFIFLAGATAVAGADQGTVQRIKVHGKSLEGNLQGESADRDVSIYLPPGYDRERNRRYPVLYLLHGYYLNDQYWTGTGVPNLVPGVSVPASMDRDAANGSARGMIIVMPNAHTIYDGSMYSSSVTTGDWESFIADDLVSFIDGHYRTIRDRMSRGLAGHSMGGYGAIRIGMKRPDVFSSLYIMSGCCLVNTPPPPAPAGAEAPAGPFANVISAEAAAWSPDPKNPPKYFDLPTKDGKPDPQVMAKWDANAPLSMIDQYIPSLKKYHAIAGDCGLQDGLLGTNKQLDQVLTAYGINHTFETYEGDHVNHVEQRIETKVLPFFSKNLSFEAAKH